MNKRYVFLVVFAFSMSAVAMQQPSQKLVNQANDTEKIRWDFEQRRFACMARIKAIEAQLAEDDASRERQFACMRNIGFIAEYDYEWKRREMFVLDLKRGCLRSQIEQLEKEFIGLAYAEYNALNPSQKK